MMKHVISATEARIHFGELLRRVVESREAVIVERDGKPQVAVLPLEEYERLKACQPGRDWEQTLRKALDLADRIDARRGGRPLPSPAEVIRETREERDEQLGLP
jgi:prevent-host-death family protein